MEKNSGNKRKRKQYYISQYRFKDIYEEDDKLHIDSQLLREYPNSENLLYEAVNRIVNREYKEDLNNRIPELFILKASNLKKKEIPLYEKLIREGVYIDRVHYIYSEKSASMTRTQKTVFLAASIKDIVEEYITLGKSPNKTIIAKWLSTRGLMLSSANLMPYFPRIVIIPDFKKEVIEDVKMVVPFEPTEEERQNHEEYLKDKEAEDTRLNDYYNKVAELKSKYTQAVLKEKFKPVKGNAYKSLSKWKEHNRRVKVEELENFHYVNCFNYKYYPVYEIDQTEEIKVFPINEFSLDSKVVTLEDNKSEVNCFDGMGLMTVEFAGQVEKFLGINNTNAIQGRLPYFKGLMVKFDIKNYFMNELKVNTITDMWGIPHNINDIDIISTESCFKAKLDFDDGGTKKWLFENMNEYYSLLNKYGFNYFGIANYAEDRLQKYTPMTYQLIQSLNLNYNDLIELSREAGRAITRVVKNADTPYVKLLLDMVEGKPYEDDIDVDEELCKIDVIRKTIELNERMIFDKEIQKFLYYKARDLMEEMMVGRIRIPSSYLYVTGDIIGFCEWAAYTNKDKVKGFLDKEEFYCNGLNGEKILVRYPLTHHSEIKIANFIESNNKYVKHLHNIIQLPMNSLVMAQMAGMDVDGDIVNVIDANLPIANNRVFKEAVIEDLVQVDPDDKVEARAVEFNIDNILEFEKVNLRNLTGKVTNINSTLQDKAFSKGNMLLNDLPNRVCKLLQGQIIDSAKTNQVIEIPKVLKDNTKKLPYYFKFIYGGVEEDYLKPKSPLSKFAVMVEKQMNKYFPQDKKEKYEIGVESEGYLDIKDVHCLMIDESKYDSNSYFEIMNKIIPIFNDYSSRKGQIDADNKLLNRLDNSEDAKDYKKSIQRRYAVLHEDIRNRCIEVCPNQSVLASIAVKIAYEKSKDSNKSDVSRMKTYSFPWVVAPEGILENLKVNEDKTKCLLIPINLTKALNLFTLPSEMLINVVGGISNISGESCQVNLSDGKYPVIKKEGRLYAMLSDDKEIKYNKISEVMKSEINELPIVEDFEVDLFGGITDVEAVKNKISSNVITLKRNEEKPQYLRVWVDKENLCGVAEKSYEDVAKRINLRDYVDRKFKVYIVKVNNKSLKVKLYQVV